MELHVQPPASSADELYEPTQGATLSAASPAPTYADFQPATVTVTVAADAAPKTKPEEARPNTPETAAAAKTARATKRRRRRAMKVEAPAWAVSVVVHVAVLMFLGLYTFSSEVKQVVANINSALVSNPTGAEEMVHIYADPSNTPRDSAVGSEGSATGSEQAGGGATASGGIGSGVPSATPRVAGGGRGIGEKTSLPGVKVVANVSGLGLLPATSKLGVDLGGGGMIGGDVTYETSDVGVALDQLAREILRHLGQHKLTVVWLFDESESMKDDQKAIHDKFDRVASELKVNADAASKKKAAEVPLTHAIVGFGNDLHFELEKPTPNVDLIGGYYHVSQNNYLGSTQTATSCAANTTANPLGGTLKGTNSSRCAGNENVVSGVVDWRPYKRVDVYAGASYSKVAGGLASGFFADNNVGVNGGVRFSF